MIEKFLNWLTKPAPKEDAADAGRKGRADILHESAREHSKTATERQSGTKDLQSAEEALKRLNNLVGLRGVKEQVERLTAFAWLMQTRESHGLGNQPMSLHMAFKGNPGTGKTTVARILGEVLYSVGVLETPKVVEVSRSDMIGEYIGQSLPKVNKVIAQAKGGILLIDEAYGIVRSDSSRDYGYEVLDHLVKVMEDQRDEFMVIFTGYQKEMDDFLDINTGLKSRINYHMVFPDYSKEELLEILLSLAKERNFEISAEAIDLLRETLEPHPDNGRYVRNLLERTIMKKAVNVYKSEDEENIKIITKEDISVPPKTEQKGIVGFVR